MARVKRLETEELLARANEAILKPSKSLDRVMNDGLLMTLPKDVADDSSVTPAIRIWAGSCPMHDSEAGAWTISEFGLAAV